MSGSETEPSQHTARRRFVVFVPLALFAVLAGVFFLRLASGDDPSRIPSVLIDTPAPALAMDPLIPSGLPALTSETIEGKVALVNVFASWCVPCRQEHPFLMELAKRDDITLVAINYKDQPENAWKFLTDLGNPYAAIGVDPKGRSAIDWGVYGVPETFLVGRDGTILYKHIGPLTDQSYEGQLLPQIAEALAE